MSSRASWKSKVMELNYYRKRDLSSKALDLIQFDTESIRQVVASERHANPDVWLIDPDAYEKDGRILRDSESPRMLAYSSKDHTLYATDGCNSCARRLPAKLEALSADELKVFARENELRNDLLDRLTQLVR